MYSDEEMKFILSSNEMSRFKSSRLSRLTSLGLTVAKAGGELARHKVTQVIGQSKASQSLAQIKAAKELIQAMGELKGGVMKLGQLLSITEDMILPPEVTTLFKQLQKDAPPMSDQDLDRVFWQSFQKKPEELFLSFERKAFACASIGQVHLAQLPNGQKVAVKVQYPDVEKAVQHDFKNLDLLDDLLGKVFRQKPNIETTIEELKETLALECDYLHEAQQTKFFKEKLSSRFAQVKIPEVYPQYSSKQILTLELMTGDTFEQTLDYTQEQKDFLGQTLYELFLFSLYEHQCLHSDPQNGNYLFRPDGIILLDFGSTRSLPLDFIQSYTQLLEGLENNDLELYTKAIIELGFFFESDISSGLIEKHFAMIHSLYSPYTGPGKKALEQVNPFEMAKGFLQQIDLKGRKSPRREFLHLDRCHLGLYTKCKAWQSNIDWETPKKEARSLLTK